MTAGYEQARRLAIIEAAKALARDAIAIARESQVGSTTWHFYHGVESAALHVLRPEMAAVHDDTSWLDRENPSFREGFLQTSAVLATASTAHDPPLRLRLPQPPEPPPSPAS